MKYGLWRDKFQPLELPEVAGGRMAEAAAVVVCCLVGIIFWVAVLGVAFEADGVVSEAPVHWSGGAE